MKKNSVFRDEETGKHCSIVNSDISLKLIESTLLTSLRSYWGKKITELFLRGYFMLVYDACNSKLREWNNVCGGTRVVIEGKEGTLMCR